MIIVTLSALHCIFSDVTYCQALYIWNFIKC